MSIVQAIKSVAVGTQVCVIILTFTEAGTVLEAWFTYSELSSLEWVELVLSFSLLPQVLLVILRLVEQR